MEVEGGIVRYRHNGLVFYQSATPVIPTSYPLLLDTALFTPGSTVTDGVIAGQALEDIWTLPSENVAWTNLIGVSPSGSSLTKTAGAGWNAGAVSTRSIASGDGYVEFTASGTGWNWLAGLGMGDTDQSYQDVDYAFYLYNGYVYIYEAGAYRGGFSAYAPGDRFQVAVESGAWRGLHGHRLAVLAGGPEFESAFGVRPTSRRPLWNGPVRCVLLT